jgi:hypothetical protein
LAGCAGVPAAEADSPVDVELPCSAKQKTLATTQQSVGKYLRGGATWKTMKTNIINDLMKKRMREEEEEEEEEEEDEGETDAALRGVGNQKRLLKSKQKVCCRHEPLVASTVKKKSL